MEENNMNEMRRGAIEEDLVFKWAPDNNKEPYFFLDLNWAPIFACPEPEKVIRLVALAREYAVNEGHGEHVALLELAAERDRLKENIVIWYRSHHDFVRKNPKRWVFLRDWLTERGHPYNPTERKKMTKAL